MPSGIYKRTKKQLERLKKQGGFKKGNTIWVGRHHTEKSKKKISKGLEGKNIGKNHWHWKGGEDEERKRHRRIRLRLRFQIFQRDNFTCQYCGRKVPEVVLEIDHRFPKSKGGKDNIGNYITSCRECNIGKGDVILKEFKD